MGVKIKTKQKMKTLKIETKKIGKNGYWDLRNQIDEFVIENFDLLYTGACRMGLNIEAYNK